MAPEYLYGVRTRRVARSGLDGLTPILLLAYVAAMVGGGVYATLKTHGSGALSSGLLWTSIVAGIVAFFAITGPMVLLGVFIASKIMKFPLGGAAYLRACGAAALPGLMLALANLLPRNVALVLLIIAAIIPLTFYALKTTFALSFVEGFVTFLLSVVTGVGGLVLAGVIVAAMQWSGIVSNPVVDALGETQATGGIAALPGITMQSLSRGTAAKAPKHPGRVKSPLDDFVSALVARLAQNPGTSREQQQRELVLLKSQAEQVGGTSNADVMNMLQDLEQRAAAAPSEKPEPVLFQELADDNVWRSSPAAIALLSNDEVSFKNFNLRLPSGFRADLISSESDPKGLSFSSGRPQSSRLVLRTVPVSNAKQHRPWIVRQPFQYPAAERDRLFTIDGVGATSEQGTINGLPFTRVVHELGQRRGLSGRSAQHITRADGAWIVIDALASAANGVSLEVLEAAVRTIRLRPEGNPKQDPFDASTLVTRLSENPERVTQLLREKGAAAEDALLPLLTDASAPDRTVITALGEVGTAKSLPALQTAARSSDAALAAAARAAIKKIQPDIMDAVAEALLDLESTDTQAKRDALERLAQLTPDEARREKVAALLEAQMLSNEALSLRDAAAPAMALWAGKSTVPRLLRLLDENASQSERDAAMQVFAKLKDERSVFPVIRWIIKDTDNVTKTLIEMGPVAEAEVVKLLKERNPSVRTAAARIIQEIGTVKSLAGLKRASQDPRDYGAAAAAQVALDIVTDRWKTNKPDPAATAPE